MDGHGSSFSAILDMVDLRSAASDPDPSRPLPHLRLRPAGEQRQVPGVRHGDPAASGGGRRSERVRRWVFNLLAAVSLVLCSITLILWLLSGFATIRFVDG